MGLFEIQMGGNKAQMLQYWPKGGPLEPQIGLLKLFIDPIKPQVGPLKPQTCPFQLKVDPLLLPVDSEPQVGLFSSRQAPFILVFAPLSPNQSIRASNHKMALAVS